MLDDRMRAPRAAGVCVRDAWLTLGTKTAQLHDEAAGIFCTSLDLGSPDVREVTNVRPDWDGIADSTRWMGGRVVSVSVSAVASAGASIDAVAASYGPFMVPSARPVLHYVLDRAGTPERVMTVRPQMYSAIVDSPDVRQIQLQFVAPDPVAYSATVRTITALVGAAVNFPYPGDVNIRPMIRITGPVTGGVVNLTNATTAAAYGRISFPGSYVIAAAHYVDVDCARRTAYLDGVTSVLANMNWTNMNAGGGWPTILANLTPQQHRLGIGGTATTTATSAVATFQDGYLL